MDIQEKILDVMEEVFGIEKDELRDNLDLDLFENELVDSLGIVTMLSELGSSVGKKFEIAKMAPESFRTVRSLTEAIKAQL